MTVAIRKARFEEIDTLVDLLKDLFSIENDFTFNADKQRKGLELIIADDRSCCILVAELQGEVIGMCTVQRLVSTAEGGYVGLVEDLIVKKHNRGNGVGEKLLAGIESWAKHQGLTRLQLLADQANLPALNFYHHKGWTITGLIGLRQSTNITL